jgi:DNA polymerase-3 subunit beta
MKLSIERAALLRAVSQAQSVVERRNTIPILANVLIEAEGDTVSFRATDLDIEVVDRIPAKVERAGATTVSAVTLHEIVRKLPDGALVSITEDGAAGRLMVEAGRSTFQLATLPKEDFPVMASSEYAANFAAPAPVLRRLFDKSKFAISTEETRYYLNGVYLHVAEAEDGPALRAVATDGHRLARIDAPVPDGAADMPGVIVPRKTVGELRKLLEDDEAEIAVSVSETKIRFATPEITLTSKVIDGTFPDYSRVIPSGNTRRMEVDAERFRQGRGPCRDGVVGTLPRGEDAARRGPADPVGERPRCRRRRRGTGRGLWRRQAGDRVQREIPAGNRQPGGSRERGVHVRVSAEPTLMREGDDLSAIYVVMPMRV